MKYERTASFRSDIGRLKGEGRFELFREVVRDKFIPAAERHLEHPEQPWPRSLRVRDVEGAPGVWEMTWEIADGRATFEWVEIDGEQGIRWRRTGSHRIFRRP